MKVALIHTMLPLLLNLLLSLLFGYQWRFVSAVKNITELPGFDGQLPFSLETGYVEVDEEKGIELFYYFVESEGIPEEDPLILWLVGGPGCSGFFALVYEFGPVVFDAEGYTEGLPSLVYNPLTWTKASNIIFVDSPVGTGYSYSRTEEGYITGDTQAVQKLLIFLSKWLDEHPKFKSNPFFLGGDSYSGIIVPVLALEIITGNLPGDNPPLNLKGYILGNPGTTSKEKSWRVPFANRMGLISDELYKSLMKNCDGDFINPPKNSLCANDLQAYYNCTNDINQQIILEPVCPETEPPRRLSIVSDDHRSMIQGNNFRITIRCTTDRYPLSEIWVNNDTVREALGVRKGTVGTTLGCNRDLPYTADIPNVVPYHKNISSLNKSYRALIYSGDKDMVVPFIETQYWINSLNYSIVDDWRPWYVDSQIAGYTRTYANNMTFATVKDAGHTAPEYKRKECQAMFERWISGVPL